MSKYVKNLLVENVRSRLAGVHDALLVNMVGINAIATTKLRSELRGKGIQVTVVKNSLAARALAGTPLAGLFDGVTGSAAICWGAEDIVALAKEVTRYAKNDKFAPFAATGGVMDGERISSDQVAQVSKWPSREEQLSLLVGQILGPGSRLASQLSGPGGALASQIKQKGEEEGSPSEEEGSPSEAAGA
jgi:large subunit ribosomal protein L10